MENLDLYSLAEANGIEVYQYCMSEQGSASTMAHGGNCYIAIDPCAFESTDIERMHLAHELGHCVTGAFYNPYSKLDIREKHERKANVWAFKHVVPLDKLAQCLKRGLVEPWQMEEIFDVPAWYIRQAMEYYQSMRPLDASTSALRSREGVLNEWAFC